MSTFVYRIYKYDVNHKIYQENGTSDQKALGIVIAVKNYDNLQYFLVISGIEQSWLKQIPNLSKTQF